MTSDSVLAISVSVAVTVKGGGGVRNHVSIFSLYFSHALYLSKSKA